MFPMRAAPKPHPVLSLLLLAIVPASLNAQWPDYKEPGVPRTPDGKVDLTAPAPRAPDGHPDLSGVWDYRRPPMPPAPAADGTAANPPGQGGAIVPLAVRRSQFWNLGASFENGLPFQPWAAQLHEQRVANNSNENPDAHCLPLGIMQLHTHGQPRKMIQSPDVIVILYEANGGIRQIFTDGRSLPEDPEPWWFGYSVGHWEGDTLVVESKGFKDLGWLDVEGSPFTDQGRFIERFTRVDYGHLEIEVTIDDPKAYTEPWTVTVHQELMPDTDLIEFVCMENEKDAGHLVGQ